MKASPLVLLLLVCSVTNGDLCPSQYKQDGDYCYQVMTFYDSFIGQPTPTSFNGADYWCNLDTGGMLTSIHSLEEQNSTYRLQCHQMYQNIGLRCVGSDCRWDDGSPLDFTYFNGDGPADDGKTRCFYQSDVGEGATGLWTEKSCGAQDNDCWICRVKAQKMECNAGETAYKGGCVSVHTTPLDQKAAEASCPGGGHLVSMHSTNLYSENERYMQWAQAAGVNGTIYIGGQFVNGVFEWTDGSYYNTNGFAKGFPNEIFGDCVQMLLDSEFGNQGQWTNIDCDVKQPYICFRDGSETASPSAPPHPKADSHCPPLQYYEGSGTIFSPNYSLSIPSQQSCEYVIGTALGTLASVKFNAYNCQGTTLSLYDGLNSIQPFKVFTTTSPSAGQLYTATSNVMKIVFTANDITVPVGTGWEAEFNGL